MKCKYCGSEKCQVTVETQPVRDSSLGCLGSFIVIGGFTFLFGIIGFGVGLLFCMVFLGKISQAPSKSVAVCQECGKRFYPEIEAEKKRRKEEFQLWKKGELPWQISLKKFLKKLKRHH